ncbi:uncharacterized protein LOC143234560 isoform X2 [Tachypleus tridentatus]|uniref:uncharacterized protein LOC143234560 isoform X2 n=1 Tax=Tachypleus tridentatus TaxID=6853 RepID=UPI003FCF9BF2
MAQNSFIPHLHLKINDHLKVLREAVESFSLPKLSLTWLHIKKYTSTYNYLLFLFSVCLFVVVLITLLSRIIIKCLKINSFSRVTLNTVNRKEEDRQTIHHSVFDLAKTAYLPGHSERCMEVIETCKYNVNWPEERTGLTLFLCACISGEKRLVNFMLERGCDVNQQNKTGFTALHQSASKGNILLTDFLLKNGADPDITTNSGVLPVQLAASGDHREVAELLAKYMVSSFLPKRGEPHSPVRSLLGLMSPPKKYLAESKVLRGNGRHRECF